MISPRLLICSGATASDNLRKGRVVLELDSIGNNANVNLRLHDVAHVLRQNLSPRLIDLLEIASYVFAADTALVEEQNGLTIQRQKLGNVISLS